MSHFWGAVESLAYFLLLAGAFFLLMRFGRGAHVTGHGHAARHSGEPPAAGLSARAIDPVCRMTVTTSEAKTSVHRGVVHYFCSSSCREAFEASPASYLGEGRATSTPQHEEHHHD